MARSKRRFTTSKLKPFNQAVVPCPDCGKPFLNERGVKAHRQRTRCGADSKVDLKCLRCGKLHQTQQALDNHTRICEVSVVCPDCGRSFTSKQSLHSHRRFCPGKEATGEMKRTFACPSCHLLLPTATALGNHVVVCCQTQALSNVQSISSLMLHDERTNPFDDEYSRSRESKRTIKQWHHPRTLASPARFLASLSRSPGTRRARSRGRIRRDSPRRQANRSPDARRSTKRLRLHDRGSSPPAHHHRRRAPSPSSEPHASAPHPVAPDPGALPVPFPNMLLAKSLGTSVDFAQGQAGAQTGTINEGPESSGTEMPHAAPDAAAHDAAQALGDLAPAVPATVIAATGPAASAADAADAADTATLQPSPADVTGSSTSGPAAASASDSTAAAAAAADALPPTGDSSTCPPANAPPMDSDVPTTSFAAPVPPQSPPDIFHLAEAARLLQAALEAPDPAPVSAYVSAADSSAASATEAATSLAASASTAPTISSTSHAATAAAVPAPESSEAEDIPPTLLASPAAATTPAPAAAASAASLITASSTNAITTTNTNEDTSENRDTSTNASTDANTESATATATATATTAATSPENSTEDTRELLNPLREDDICVACREKSCCVYIRRHLKCGPHAICIPCSYKSADLKDQKVARAGRSHTGQLACPVCSRLLGTRRRALDEEDRMVPYKKRPSDDLPSSSTQTEEAPPKQPRTEPKQAPSKTDEPKKDSTAPPSERQNHNSSNSNSNNNSNNNNSSTSSNSLYSILEVPLDATDEALERAYKSKARVLHPDKPGGDKEQFQALLSAYKVLLDPKQRAKHDKGLRKKCPEKSPEGDHQGSSSSSSISPENAQLSTLLLYPHERAVAFRSSMEDVAPKLWPQKLSAIPDEPWTIPMLQALTTMKKMPNTEERKEALLAAKASGKSGASHEEPPQDDAGLVRYKRTKVPAYWVRLGWENWTLNTTFIYDIDEALAAHATLLRLKKVAAARLLAGESLEEAIKTFQYCPVELRMSAVISRMRNNVRLRKGTPRTSNLELAVEHRRCMSNLLQSKSFTMKKLDALGDGFKEQLEKTRLLTGQQMPDLAELAKAELRNRMDHRVQDQRPAKRIRGKTPPLLALPGPSTQMAISSSGQVDRQTTATASSSNTAVIPSWPGAEAPTDLQMRHIPMPWFNAVCRSKGINTDEDKSKILKRLVPFRRAIENTLLNAFNSAHASVRAEAHQARKTTS